MHHACFFHFFLYSSSRNSPLSVINLNIMCLKDPGPNMQTANWCWLLPCQRVPPQIAHPPAGSAKRSPLPPQCLYGMHSPERYHTQTTATNRWIHTSWETISTLHRVTHTFKYLTLSLNRVIWSKTTHIQFEHLSDDQLQYVPSECWYIHGHPQEVVDITLL